MRITWLFTVLLELTSLTGLVLFDSIGKYTPINSINLRFRDIRQKPFVLAHLLWYGIERTLSSQLLTFLKCQFLALQCTFEFFITISTALQSCCNIFVFVHEIKIGLKMGKIKVRRFKMSSKKPNKWTVTDDGKYKNLLIWYYLILYACVIHIVYSRAGWKGVGPRCRRFGEWQ